MTMKIDLVRLTRYLLKRIWLPILCALIGFGGMYYRSAYMMPDTYTAFATMYVFNGNPNAINYQYTTATDINTSVMLVDTYAVVIRSNKVMEAVAEQLDQSILPQYIASTLSMSSVGETGVMQIACTTPDPQLSMDICNAVVSIAPAEIIRVVNAGSAEVIDYAELPLEPNNRQPMPRGRRSAMPAPGCAPGESGWWQRASFGWKRKRMPDRPILRIRNRSDQSQSGYSIRL